MTKNKTILVTGASSKVINGFITVLLENEFNVIATTRKRSNNYRKDVRWIEQDISNSDANWSILNEVDLILHAAAVSNTYNETEYLNVNVLGTKRLVEAAQKYGVKQFIYISSILADSTCGAYGSSKAEAEKIISSHLDQFVIIRSSQIFGYSNSPIDKLIKDLTTKKINFYPGGSIRNLYPLYFDELIHFLKEIIIEERKVPEVCTFTGPDQFNYKGLVSEIVKNQNSKGIQIPVWGLLIKTAAFFMKTFKIRIGIYYDQIFRLYYANPEIENRIISPVSLKSILRNKA